MKSAEACSTQALSQGTEKAKEMPTILFIDSQGRIYEKWTGTLDKDNMVRVTKEMRERDGAG